MIDHISIGALAAAFATGVKKVTSTNPQVTVTPLERAALYGVGIILLGMLSWVVVTTNENSTILASDRILFTQVQSNLAALQSQLSRLQEDNNRQDQHIRDLEYKVFGK